EETEYVALDNNHLDGFEANWPIVTLVLSDAPQKLTREDILDEWPDDYDKPSASVLRNWLIRAVTQGLVASEGSGRKRDPFRYCLPAREEVWRQESFLYDHIEKQIREQQVPFCSLREKKRRDQRAERESAD